MPDFEPELSGELRKWVKGFTAHNEGVVEPGSLMMLLVNELLGEWLSHTASLLHLCLYSPVSVTQPDRNRICDRLTL